MISRRRIISRSHEGLSETNHSTHYEYEDNFWTNKEKLFRDHIQEILNKWEQIDDEIWAKIICMEKNRRVAKAYARAQILAINGSDLGFDGHRIGLNGFQNPNRDSITQDVKKYIGSVSHNSKGIKLKIDDSGNILIKRVGKCNVYIGANYDISHTNSGFTLNCIDFDKSFKLFDMKAFQTQVYKELRNSYPDRRKLELQCITFVAFVEDTTNILDHPIWTMIINIVALDLLKTKFPILAPKPKFMTIFEDSFDEKMYPKVNYKYSDRYFSSDIHNTSKDSTDSTLLSTSSSSSSSALSSRRDSSKLMPENENFAPNSHRNRGLDDLYYCGLKARVPNFGRQRSSIAICANNSSIDLRKYFNSSLHLSSLPNHIPNHKPTNGNYTCISTFEDPLESLDMFGGRESYRKKQLSHYNNVFEKYLPKHQISQNRRSFSTDFKDYNKN